MSPYSNLHMSECCKSLNNCHIYIFTDIEMQKIFVYMIYSPFGWRMPLKHHPIFYERNHKCKSEKYLGDQIHEDGCEASITATLDWRIPSAIDKAENIINSINQPGWVTGWHMHNLKWKYHQKYSQLWQTDRTNTKTSRQNTKRPR